MNGLDLFAGISGLGLGLRIAAPGYRTVGYVERDAYAASVLLARMEVEALERAPIWCGNLEEFDASAWRGTVDIVTAGFPCQPWSVAGKQKGTRDERWLWPALLGAICEVGCDLVLLENVPGLVSGGGLADVLSGLAESGFAAQWLCLRASNVGATHQRNRIFLLAYRDRERLKEFWLSGVSRAERTSCGDDADGRGAAVACRSCGGLRRLRQSWASSGFVERCGQVLGDAALVGEREPDDQTRTESRKRAWRNTGGASGVVDYTSSRRETGAGAEDGYEVRMREPGGRRDAVVRAKHPQRRQGRECRNRRGQGRRSSEAARGTGEAGEALAHTSRKGRQQDATSASRHEAKNGRPTEVHYEPQRARAFPPGHGSPEWTEIVASQPWLAPAVEPGVRYLVDGLPRLVDEFRADRLRCLGNAVVPLQAAVAFVELVRRAADG